MFIALVLLHKKIYPALEEDVKTELERYKGYGDRIRPLVKEIVHYLYKAIKDGKKILVEGANAALLDIDFGKYPYVTSSMQYWWSLHWFRITTNCDWGNHSSG